MNKVSLFNAISGYKAALCFATSADSSGDDDSSFRDKGIDTFAPDTERQIVADCKKFLFSAKELIDSDTKHGGDDEPYYNAGIDFFFTRHHHGAGFWDGDWSNGDELTKIAQAFPETDPYLSDDNTISI